jgi:hypothetical protein
MTRPVPFPVTHLSTFNGLPRISNDCVELTLHTCVAGSVELMRELLDAELPVTAHVEISMSGETRLLSVQASDSVDA